MKKIQFLQFPITCFFALLIITTLFSCYSRKQIYRTSKLSKLDKKELHYVAIDATDTLNMWELSNVDQQGEILTAHFKRASPDYVKSILSIRGNKGNKRNQDKVLLYVKHATAKTYEDTFDGSLETSNIFKIVIFRPDGLKAAGLVVAGVVVVGITTLAIVCGCPYVHVETPDGSLLAGELYAGAAFPQLERHDWLLLPPLEPVGDQYALSLTNELYENQHTNLLELEALDAPVGTLPLYDKYGRLFTINTLLAPVKATDVSGHDVLDQVQNKEDGQIFHGDLNNQRPDATERLSLRFPRPAGTQQAKLLIHAKNNNWLDFIYFEFQNELGVYGPKIQQKYLKKSAAENRAWMERQKMPLAVWLETSPGHWEKADYFNAAGPMVYKSDVLQIDLSKVQGDIVNLRLEFGFNFWEIDQVALDYSPEVPVIQRRLPVLSAITESGEDVAPALAKDDNQYYDQPNIGDAARITFAAPPLQSGQVRNLVLHAKGHYEIKHLPATGHPGYFQLKRWEKENALPKLSRERWLASQKLSSNQDN